MNRRSLGFLLLLSWPLLALAQDQRIAGLYARSLAGDKDAVVECIAALDKALAAAPDDQLARVYLGSAWTLRSRDLSFGKAKLDALRKGLALMDEAAARAPQNARVLLTRAVTNKALPVLLGRRQVARAELNEIVAMLEKDPARLSPADQQLLYLNAGAAAHQAGEKARALELWRRGLTIKADPGLTAELRSALSGALK